MYPMLLSIELHHDGRFTTFPGRKYVDGQKVIVDWVNGDTFSISDFNFIINNLGHKNQDLLFYHFKTPGSDLDVGLNRLANEFDLRKLIKHAKTTRFIEVYVEHGSKTLLNHCTLETGQSSNIKRKLFTTNEGEESHGLDGNDVREPDDVNKEEDFVEPVNEFDVDMDRSDKVNEVKVDMSKFNGTFKRNDDNWLGKGVGAGVGELHVGDEVTGIDFDAYDNGDCSNEELSKRKKKPRQLRVNYAGPSSKTNVPPFYVGQSFSDKRHINELVKAHAVDTRRDIKMVKNDKRRVGAICHGFIPRKLRETGNRGGKPSKKVKPKGEPCKSKEKQSKGEGSKGKKVISKIVKKSLNPKCPWTLHVSKLGHEPWTVKTFIEEHKCLQIREM